MKRSQCRRWVNRYRSADVRVASVHPSTSDIMLRRREHRNGPCVDGSELARTFFTSADWSVQPCVRPLSAVHMTAGHTSISTSRSAMAAPSISPPPAAASMSAATWCHVDRERRSSGKCRISSRTSASVLAWWSGATSQPACWTGNWRAVCCCKCR